MRVGIDARLLSEQVTGIGRYTTELTRELIKNECQYFLYSARPVERSQWQQTNATLRTANLNSRSGRMVWSQTWLPYWAWKDNLDVFWGATHRLPQYLPANIARVVTIHDLVWKHAGDTMRPFSKWLETKLMPQAIRLADRIVTDSFSTAQAIEEEYPLARERVHVVYPGVTELPQPHSLESLKVLNIDKPYFLFVGTLEPRKNLRRLLQAFSLLDNEARNTNLLVIAGGKGWGSISVESLIKEFNLTGQVIVLGYVNDVALSTLYAHSRFLVMPSLYEGFGLPLVEAMAFGAPVLTSNISSMPEVAGDAGVLVDPYDVQSIAEGLYSLVSNNELRDRLAQRSKPNARRFSWEKASKEIFAVFQAAKEERDNMQGGRK